MITTVYPPSGPQYFHEPPSVVYEGPKMLVKKEPVDDLMDSEGPVDMSLTAREHQPNVPRHIALGPEGMGGERSHFYGSYIHPHHHQNHRHPSRSQHTSPQRIANKHLDQLCVPPADSCPPSISPSTPPSDHEAFRLKGSDGKLTLPSLLTKNSRAPSFRTVDMLPAATHQRAKREFVPDNKKDENYWCKRLKNNDSARRSRVKRKALEKMMESRLLELQKENIELKHEMAALKRRFGVEDGSSSSDTPSPQDQTTASNSPVPSSSPEENGDKNSQGEELEQQSSSSDDSRSNDDSRVYSMGSMTSLSTSLGPAGRDRTDSMGSSSSSLTSSRISNSSRPGSRSSQAGSVDVVLRTDVTGAIDLTSDHNNRSPPGWESSSSESYSSSSNNSNRRYSCVSSDSSSMDDGSSHNMKVFPLKCRWKKEMHSAHSHVSEELQ